MTDTKKTPAGRKSRASSSRRGKTLTSTEKAEAIALWRAGSVTLDQLAEKFHRDRVTFLRLFNKEGVTKGEARDEHERKVAEAVETAAITDAATLATRIRETKEEHYKMAKAIAHATYKILAKAAQENRAVGTSLPDLKALQIASQTLKVAREERYAVLGMNEERRNEDTPMPDLVVQELTSDEIKQMHNQQISEDLDELGEIGDMSSEGDR